VHFHITGLTFDHPKWVFDLGPCLVFEVLDFALGFVQHAALAQLGTGAASHGDLPYHFTVIMLFALLDTGVTSIGVDRVFLAVQQFGNLSDSATFPAVP
jgi:hypothetical protein